MKKTTLINLMAVILIVITTKVNAQTPVGIFDGQSDVGRVKTAGTGTYDDKMQAYKITGSGTNIWGTHDEFHFVWKKMKGDFILRCDANFIGKGVEEHRKIGWMVRSSLDTGSKNICAVVHGAGLTSLQFRKETNGAMAEKKFDISLPDVIQLERKGNTYIMSVAHKGELFVSQELSDLDLGDDVYVGLLICPHNPNVVEKAVFNNVRIVVPAPSTLVPYRQYLGSDLKYWMYKPKTAASFTRRPTQYKPQTG